MKTETKEKTIAEKFDDLKTDLTFFICLCIILIAIVAYKLDETNKKIVALEQTIECMESKEISK